MDKRVSSGIEGLDAILQGGLIAKRSYLVRGGAGTGKTTLGLHFLIDGARHGERAMFVNFGLAEDHVRFNAAQCGMDLHDIVFLDLSPSSESFSSNRLYDIFEATEIELEEFTRRITAAIAIHKPQRIFIDAMLQLRYLVSDDIQFRRHVLAFLRYLTEQGVTVLYTSSGDAGSATDSDLQFLSDGIIHLERLDSGRYLSVTKLRGSDFQNGRHAMRIGSAGVAIYPCLVPEVHIRDFAAELLPSGIRELDQMLGGGIERGTISILTGPSGVGKTTLGMQFLVEAATRGERSVAYVFEEGLDTLMHRCEQIGMPVREVLQDRRVSLVPVEPLRFSAHEFSHMVRNEVENNGAKLIMIDSVAGYRLSLRGEDLVAQLHALSRYLHNMGVTLLLMNEQEHITGDFRITDVGVSYMSDNVLFLRYVESRGEIWKVIGVLKKRAGDFEKLMRQFEITSQGIKVGMPLSNLRGLLTGVPEFL